MFTNFFILQVGSSEIIYKLNRACQIKLLLNRRVIKLLRQNIYSNVSYIKNKAPISRQMILYRVNRDAIVKSVSDVGRLNQPRLRPRPRAEREERVRRL